MWENLSLRTRLFLPLGVFFLAALVLGGVSLHVFSTSQLADENAAPARTARMVAEALNSALGSSPDPERMLDVFAQSLGTSETIHFRRDGLDSPGQSAPSATKPVTGVPGWFVNALNIPDVGASFPVMIRGHHAGDIVFSPDLSPDLYEKWIAFCAIVLFFTALLGLIVLSAYFITGSALRPLANLGHGLTRMRSGIYDSLIPVSGPPELRNSCEEANQLAGTLSRLSHDNRVLLRKMVSLQDDERRDLARELHDELGPLLFGIRANTVGLLEATPQDKAAIDTAARQVVESVEALQQANRRILDRLRPLYIQELGLERSIQTLLRNAKLQAPDLEMTSSIDHRLAEVDGILSQTVYRVIQEAITNVLRHARARSAHVEARIDRHQLLIEISDDGNGFPPSMVFGRGLTGMHERARALSGTFQFSREKQRTYVRCSMPVDGN